jgi:hypothetical protein
VIRRNSGRMRIETWNVNSIRSRLNLVMRFLEEERPGVGRCCVGASPSCVPRITLPCSSLQISLSERRERAKTETAHDQGRAPCSTKTRAAVLVG